MDAKYNIGAAALRTGLTAHVLRAWERRYRALRPSRTDGNQRLYTEKDVERLRLLGRLCRSGHRIGRIAGAPVDDLLALAVGTEAAADTGGARPAPEAADLLARCRGAVEDMDGGRLGRLLETARVFLPIPRLLDDVVLPLMRWIGDRWKAGGIRIAHEHVATGVVRSLLDRIAVEAPPPDSAPLVVIATPPGEWHELGALAARVTARGRGFRVLYLGVGVPAAELEAMAELHRPAAVVLGVTFAAADRSTIRALREIRKRLDGKSFLLIGGPAAARCARAAGVKPAAVVESLVAFGKALDRLASRPGRSRRRRRGC
jgi:methanogenic corrinoid protein MtbC1